MLNQAVQFLLDTLVNLLVLAFLLRFYLQAMRAPFHNPFSQFIVAVTDFAVRPVRRVIPGVWGLDLGTLLLAWLLEAILLFALYWLSGFPFLVAGGGVYLGLALLAAVKLLKTSIYILIVVVFVQALLSWINPYNPLAPVLYALSRPFMRFFQRLIPPIANIDLSPLFIFIACQLFLMLPVAWLESLALRMM